MSEQTPFLTVDLPQGRRLSFPDLDAIGTWISDERNRFAWLFSGRDLGGGNQLRDHYQRGFQNLQARLQEWRNRPSEPGPAQVFRDTLSSFYSNERTCLSDAAPVQCAIEINSKLGERAAAGAFALLMNEPCEVDFDTVRGIIRAILLRDGIEPSSPGIVQSVISRLTSEAAVAAKIHGQVFEQVADKANTFVSEKEQQFAKQSTETSERVQGFVDRLNEAGNEAIKSIETTEAAYKEQMRLQAPVEYWDAKAGVHSKAISGSRRRLIVYALGASAALIFGLIWLALKSAAVAATGNTPGDAVAIYLKFVAVGAIVTTIAFWAGRVLLRIYLSDRHLLADAEERVAMIKTYLALSHEGKVEATDRALILAPIFRSAADGIVKEEGPDPSFAGIIARAMEFKAGAR
jgi:hypothetical protein